MAGDASAAPATCRCGHGRDHYMVSPEPKHSGLGSFWVVLMGVSAAPYKVEFRCRVCKQVFDQITDPAECKKFL